MSIYDGTGLIVWEGGLFEPGSDLLRRVQWAFAKIRADGGTIILNEAGRPFGVPGDALVHDASQTASGRSTVYYQWGRYLRHETPSAANPANGPYASEHTTGKAVDTDAPTDRDEQLRAKYFAMVGLVNTISSESWHWAIRHDPQPGVDLTSTAGTVTGTIPNQEEDDMYSDADRARDTSTNTAIKNLTAGLTADPGFQKSEVYKAAATKVNNVFRNRLGREADATGLGGYVAMILAGQTDTDVDRLVMASQEYRAKVVSDLYQRLLGRKPDPAGLNGFVAALAAGHSAADVEAAIKGSAEYRQKHPNG